MLMAGIAFARTHGGECSIDAHGRRGGCRFLALARESLKQGHEAFLGSRQGKYRKIINNLNIV